jgi:hypothetical protein
VGHVHDDDGKTRREEKGKKKQEEERGVCVEYGVHDDDY